jgi:hypothetical protein
MKARIKSEVCMRGLLPAEESFKWIGLILISILMLYVIIQWTTSGVHVQRGIEQGSLMYTIANSVNALSTMEEGEIIRHLTNYYDINLECDGTCSVRVAVYDKSGNRQKESNEVLIIGKIEPVKLENVNKITLTKDRTGRIVLVGEHTGEASWSPLQIPKYSPRCIESYRNLIKDASDKYGIEEELIAAIITRESSWKPNVYRYEPYYQVRYLEGTNWENDPAWLKSGQTIGEWFASHSDRAEEKSRLNDEQLNLIAQTEVSTSYGLMQVMYPTAVTYCGYSGNPDSLKDPATNIDCGTNYLKDLLDRYGDEADAVSAYNAGSSVWRANAQNRQYTQTVLGYYDAFNSCPA